MDYKINAIPTRYKNLNFRSRLEAKWAAFFDLLNWKWEYEPCDFNGWIPDFVLIGECENVFVEVKPVSKFPENVGEKLVKSGYQYGSKKDAGDEALIVGLTLIDDYFGGLALGWLDENGMGWWEPASIGKWYGSESELKNRNLLYGFCHSFGSYHDRITGCYDGGTTEGDLWWQPSAEYNTNKIIELWKEAGNITQWKKQ
ncbi:MAG TPA: hypothetical protein V6D21_00665 [Candidatus Obscuribacterales bacterium]